jgi:hypothetical protein
MCAFVMQIMKLVGEEAREPSDNASLGVFTLRNNLSMKGRGSFTMEDCLTCMLCTSVEGVIL